MSRRLWYVLLNGLVGAWLLAAGLIAVAPGVLRAGPWLVVHLLLLGAVSTAIFIWSQHFADTLLRRRAVGGRVGLGVRILTHTAGSLAVVAGIVAGSWPV
ncbi:MAG TPA: nitrite reductase, partial [Thermopolyspora sp.]